ncbi:hypothetical protein [Rhizobium sp. C4]|uniref:hypothetical protein n=1 Tax=Rhizobium sp. C4 TaxID=1349800 RepID=UPI001E551D26|nr:hypothetical protein [Rhizobium sp. C4]MCD2172451.1 hypothetical protein [Rhizobium sp. C4]
MAEVAFVFSGALVQASFRQFAQHRANRLSLGIDFGAASDRFFDVTVTGDEALVDMFEMACSLGPYDCIIQDVTRRDIAPAGNI